MISLELLYAKYDWYKKLLSKISSIKRGDLNLNEYQKDVKGKLSTMRDQLFAHKQPKEPSGFNMMLNEVGKDFVKGKVVKTGSFTVDDSRIRFIYIADNEKLLEKYEKEFVKAAELMNT